MLDFKIILISIIVYITVYVVRQKMLNKRISVKHIIIIIILTFLTRPLLEYKIIHLFDSKNNIN